jgi:Flp pilus assembly protein TadG
MTTFEHRRAGGDGGAVLVEFAIVLPILLLLIFSVMEFGWAFSQHMDVRHGARETARLAAVNYGTGTGTAQSDSLIAEGCDRMDESGGTAIDVDTDGTSSGSRVTVTVTRPLDTLTGFLDFALDGVTLTSEVDTRAERTISWVDRTQSCT